MILKVNDDKLDSIAKTISYKIRSFSALVCFQFKMKVPPLQRKA